MIQPWMALALVLAAPPATLRYKHTVGQVIKVRVSDSMETLLAQGASNPRLAAKRETSMLLQRTVKSASGEDIVLEERVLEGTTTEENAQGRRNSVVPETLRRITVNTRGVSKKTEAVDQPGIPNKSGGFMEGFSLALPPKAAAVGSTWTDALVVTGPDGKPMKMTISSKWAADEKRQEKFCARFEVKFSSTFLPIDSAGKPSGQGTVAGTGTFWFDPKAGQDVELELRMNVEITTQTSPPTRAITRWTVRQVVQQK